jgi:2-methylisocitrate lyase-like PEP mutase family enzyme
MLKEPGIIVAPGAYDGFSARLIEAAGFRCVYMTGAGTAASHLGQPDLGLATLTEMANHAGHLASCVSLPVIADADTGYGNVLNVVRTVREYERAGVAGLHMEDQVAPKKCGHIAGKQIIPTQEFCDKIRAASEYRTDPDFVIIARTDARAVTSLDDAIDRGNRAAEAGADVIFVEAPQSEDEIQRIARIAFNSVRTRVTSVDNLPWAGTSTSRGAVSARRPRAVKTLRRTRCGAPSRLRPTRPARSPKRSNVAVFRLAYGYARIGQPPSKPVICGWL